MKTANNKIPVASVFNDSEGLYGTTVCRCLVRRPHYSFRDIFNFIPPFFPSSLLSGGLGGPHQEGDGLGLASPYAALLFPSNNKDNFDIYIYTCGCHFLCA